MSKFYENNFISLIEALNPKNVLIIDYFRERLNLEVIISQLRKNITINIINSNPSFHIKKLESENSNLHVYNERSQTNILKNDIIIINSDSEETIKELLNTIYSKNKTPVVFINTETYVDEDAVMDKVIRERKDHKSTSAKDVFTECNQKINDIKRVTQEFIIESSDNLFYQEVYTSPFMILVYEKNMELFNTINSLEIVNSEKEMYSNKLNKIYHDEKVVKNQSKLLLKRNEILSEQTKELFETVEYLRKELEQEKSGKLPKILGTNKTKKIKSILKK